MTYRSRDSQRKGRVHAYKERGEGGENVRQKKGANVYVYVCMREMIIEQKGKQAEDTRDRCKAYRPDDIYLKYRKLANDIPEQ
jgi:hypothetical protein